MADDRLQQLDYYTLLQVDQGATTDAIRHAFHTFALKFHPDNHTTGSPEKRRRAAEIYRRGAEAYRVLLSPESRARYDAGLAEGKLRLVAAEEPSPAQKRAASQPNRKAQPFYRKAMKALDEGDARTARLNLRIAQGHDPACALIADKLAELDSK